MPNNSLLLTLSPEELRLAFLNLKVPSDVAELLDLDYGRLAFHLYKAPPELQYSCFEIPKKTGGTRLICTPITALKLIQSKLNQVLQAVYKPKPSVHGFVNGRSIVTNASPHLKRRYVFNIDLENFFPSINFGRVRGLFISMPYSLPPEVATVLAKICCYDNKLPQGAPTSPVIANMICVKMDSEMQRFAKANKCFYTRYADDLTFSTNLSTFPGALATVNSLNQIEIGGQLQNVIESNGFQVNIKKVRLQKRKQNRAEVTGIVVNEGPNVSRKYVRQLKAMLHAWEKYGLPAAQSDYSEKYDYRHRLFNKQKVQFQYVVKGKLEYLGMIKGKTDPVYLSLYNKLHKHLPELAPKQIDSEIKTSREEFVKSFTGSFSLEEINVICFKLDIDRDEISGLVKSEKAINLYLYLDRRGKLKDLIDYCKTERPLINW